jgi:hypothetical protein
MAVNAAPGCLNFPVAIRAAVQLVGAARGVACSVLFRTQGRQDLG